MKGTMIQFAGNGNTYQGYLSVPETGKGPGVIVIQEWWGLVDHIQEVCDRFADAGYVALAPDFYHGEKTTSPDAAGKLMMALNIADAEKIIRGAIAAMTERPELQGTKVGVVGFCMGGQLALFTASLNHETVAACVDFYGIHPNVQPDYQGMKAEVLGLFAEKDGFVNSEAIEGLRQQLTAAGCTFDFHVYEGTDHAFFNDHRPQVYNAEAAQDAWNKTLALFERTLH